MERSNGLMTILINNCVTFLGVSRAHGIGFCLSLPVSVDNTLVIKRACPPFVPFSAGSLTASLISSGATLRSSPLDSPKGNTHRVSNGWKPYSIRHGKLSP